MTPDELTCELVDERELDTRYLADALPPLEAEAFERHYFGCERCWGLVAKGVAVRTVEQEVAQRRERPLRRWQVPALGVAAAIVVAVGSLLVMRRPPTETGNVERGGQGSIAVAARRTADSLFAVWARVPGSVRYRVRLFTPAGERAMERDVRDTVLALGARAVARPRGSPAGSLYWHVEALDERGSVLAKSGLIRAQ